MNYLILAMKRSGHHLVAEWIKWHTAVLPFFNNVCHGWENKELRTMIRRKKAKKGIANIEDFNPDDWKKFNFPSFPFLKNCKVIVVIRTLDNWLASCYKRKFQDNEERKDVYKFLDKPYINDSKRQSPSRIDLYCKQLKMAYNNPSVIYVQFDRFVKDQDYRIRLAEKLGFNINVHDNNSVGIMTKYGGGSSFGNLDVFNRAEEFRDDEEFVALHNKAFRKALDAVKK